MKLCLFCAQEHSAYILCQDRIEARACYIKNCHIEEKKPQVQAKITKFFSKKEPGSSVLVEPPPVKKVESEVILISSEDETEPCLKRRKSSRIKVRKCFACGELKDSCGCDSESDVKNRIKKIVDTTINDPKIRSHKNQMEAIFSYWSEKLNGRKPDVIGAEIWMQWIIEYAEGKGRCEYRDGSKGIAPKTAKVLFNMMTKNLQDNFGLNLMEKFPCFRIFVARWQKVINNVQLYQRKQANYFSRKDVADYMNMFEKVALESEGATAYYAKMAAVIISVSILFVGCRLGSLLDIKIGAVEFKTIQKPNKDSQPVVVMYPGGSKTDPTNQRTTPIVFGALPDKQICPIKAFDEWLKCVRLQKFGSGLKGRPSDPVFPLFSSNKRISTSHFTQLVKKMESTWSEKLPEFQAHVGRCTITTLALFAKDEKGTRLIDPLTLEHQLSWVRNTQVLPNYMGHKAVCASGGFFDSMTEIRTQRLEESVNEEAIKTLHKSCVSDSE